MRFPNTLLEFQAQFPDDDHCWAYLRRARWPRGFLCPRCGGRGSHFLARHKKGISALQFQRDTGVGSYQAAWALLHKLRSGLMNLPAPLLKGDVEADETYIGGYRAGLNGRGAGKTGVR